MKKALLISSSLSSKSINFEVLKWLKQFVPNKEESKLVSIRDFELPLYNVDIEKEPGIAENGLKFMQLIEGYDKLIFGIAEHNGSLTAGFKNLLDWLSRINKDYKFLSGKDVLLVGTSPSSFGAKSAILHAKSVIQMLGGNVMDEFPIPSYYATFSITESGHNINNQELKGALLSTLGNFLSEKEVVSEFKVVA